MTRQQRPMRLTERHVAFVQPPEIAEGLPPPPAGMRATSEADHLATIAELFGDDRDGDETWVFAYGSLIWKPACDYVEARVGLLHGWHRAFCLGWNTRHRGSEQRPGLMLALDRGGACKGVLYRLPPTGATTASSSSSSGKWAGRPRPFHRAWCRCVRASGASGR